MKRPTLLFAIAFASFRVFSQSASDLNQKAVDAMAAADSGALAALAAEKDFEKTLDPSLLYFAGLHFEEAGDLDGAKRLYDAGWKRAGGFDAKLCAQRRIALEDENSAVIERYIREYPAENEGKIALAKFSLEKGRWKKAADAAGTPSLQRFANPVEVKSTDSFSRTKKIEAQLEQENEMARLRVLALARQNDAAFLGYLQIWIAYWQISASHRAFAADLETLPADEYEERFGSDWTRTIDVFEMRLAVADRDYEKAAVRASRLSPFFATLPDATFSDICKACFFSSYDDAIFERQLEAALAKTKSRKCKFFATFWLGRLACRRKDFREGRERFKSAISLSTSAAQYDQALWYYMDASQKISLDHFLASVYSYAKTFNDPSYFTDLFDAVFLSLLSERRWDDVVRVYSAVADLRGLASTAQFAYMTGRLLEEGLAKLPNPKAVKDSVVKKAFQAAYDCPAADNYYRFMAASRLAVPTDTVMSDCFKRPGGRQFARDSERETLLLGLAKYGFADRVFAEYMKDYQSVGLSCASELARLLALKGGEDSRFYATSMRILNYALRSGAAVTRGVLEMLYPRPFLSAVREHSRGSATYEAMIFGLTRCESYFQAAVTSRAGAVGLMQLMPSTAAEIAKRMKMADFDLTDPETNLLFGTSYLSEVIGRTGNSPLLGVFSYNGGITRVRTWAKSSPGLAPDIFLELVPIAETRGYGRNVLAATVIYGWLYYGLDYRAVIDEVMKIPQ